MSGVVQYLQGLGLAWRPPQDSRAIWEAVDKVPGGLKPSIWEGCWVPGTMVAITVGVASLIAALPSAFGNILLRPLHASQWVLCSVLPCSPPEAHATASPSFSSLQQVQTGQRVPCGPDACPHSSECLCPQGWGLEMVAPGSHKHCPPTVLPGPLGIWTPSREWPVLRMLRGLQYRWLQWP